MSKNPKMLTVKRHKNDLTRSRRLKSLMLTEAVYKNLYTKENLKYFLDKGIK